MTTALIISTACFALLSVLLGWVIVKLYRERCKAERDAAYWKDRHRLMRQTADFWMDLRLDARPRTAPDEWPEIIEKN